MFDKFLNPFARKVKLVSNEKLVDDRVKLVDGSPRVKLVNDEVIAHR